MPGAQSPVKSSGDIHPPEIEDTVPGLPDEMGTEGTPRDADRGRANDLAREKQEEGRPGKGENQAGFLKERESGQGGREGG